MARAAQKPSLPEKRQSPKAKRPVDVAQSRPKTSGLKTPDPKTLEPKAPPPSAATAKQPVRRPPGPRASSPRAVDPQAATAAQLLDALQNAERRIAELEAQQSTLVDRLTWVLDTLETLLADED